MRLEQFSNRSGGRLGEGVRSPGDAGRATFPANDSLNLELIFAIRIDNLDSIREAFGAEAAEFVAAEVQGALRGLLASNQFLDGRIASRAPGQIDLFVRCRKNAGPGAPSLLRACVHDWLSALGRTPVVGRDCAVHVAMSVVCSELEAEIADDEARCFIQEGAWAQMGRLPSAHLLPSAGTLSTIRDMAVAVSFYEELNSGALHWAWEPIRNLDDGDTLYWRGVLSAMGRDGGVEERKLSREALERLGLTRAFDQFAVLDAMAVLEAVDRVSDLGVPAISVSVSASSFAPSYLWEPILARLKRSRLLARRLFIAIDCAQPFPLGSGLVSLRDELHRLGCRVVLEGLGSGHGSIASLLALRPDVVTLDSFFVRLAARQQPDEQLFRHILGVANAIAPAVVVEGVDTSLHATVAQASGAHWIEGDEAGRRGWRLPGWPGESRSWPGVSSDVPCPTALGRTGDGKARS